MSDEEEKQIMIIALMIIVLICLIFLGLVTFGYVSAPSGENNTNNNNTYINVQNVTGTVFYNDGITPFELSDASNGSYLNLVYLANHSSISTLVTDSSGKFTSPDVPAGDYELTAYYYNVPQGQVVFNIPNGTTVQQNLTTYRMPMN